MNEDSEAEAADRSRRLNRRSLLLGGGGITLAVGGFVASAATGLIKLNPTLSHTINALGDVPQPTTTAVAPVSLVTTSVASVYSPTRGASLNLVSFLPAGVAPAKLPVCLLLPGLPGDPRRALPGLSSALSAEAASHGGKPFAVVALDGGQNCWHQQRPGADPMDVLVDELPAWLAAHGFHGAPVLTAGIGMGGFDALLYARRRNERGDPVRAVAAIAPGLSSTWAEASSRHTFSGEAQWAELDPLRHVSALGRTAVGIWCGDRDPNLAAIREFVKLARPQVADLDRPGHSSVTLRAMLASALHFLGADLPVHVKG
ncbi:MAG TPA: alpha/beta hydrolase-fold protein [Pseudonocardiaceae bacterium]|nr:alpha/beta hydrolase-fold protein [Pseudonocardiaceae bacterium]